jgi:hypothetical protein
MLFDPLTHVNITEIVTETPLTNYNLVTAISQTGASLAIRKFLNMSQDEFDKEWLTIAKEKYPICFFYLLLPLSNFI